MAVPFSNRSALCSLPELCLRGKPPVTEAELRRSFLTVANPLHTAFACIQLLSPNEVRFCFTSTRQLEDVMNTGLTFRGHPLTLGPIHTKKWVTIRRLAYATPQEFVRRALAPYGEVDSIRPEIIDKVATGTLFAQVDITKDIPSRLRIRGHNCIIWYRDQPRTCFLCGQHGHERRHCPQRQGRRTVVPQQFSQEPGTPPRRHPPTPSVSPARSPLGTPHHGPPRPRRLATAVAQTPTSALSRTSSPVTPGRSFAAVTALEPSTSTHNRFSLLPVEDTPLPPRRRRNKKSKAPGKPHTPRPSTQDTDDSPQATRQGLLVDVTEASSASPVLEPSPPLLKSPAAAASTKAQSPSGDDVPATPSLEATPPARDLTASAPSPAESQMAFLPAPREGNTDDSPPVPASEAASSDEEPPTKKSCPPSGPAPDWVTSIPTVGAAVLPITSGVEDPFGLPSALDDPTTNPVQEPTFPSQSRAIHVEDQQGNSSVDFTSPPPEVSTPTSPSHLKDSGAAAPQTTPPVDPTSLQQQEPTPPSQEDGPSVVTPRFTPPVAMLESASPSAMKDKSEATLRASVPADPTFLSTQESAPPPHSEEPSMPTPPAKGPVQSCGTSGPRKSRRGEPRLCENFDPFTRRRTAPRPLVGATRRRPRALHPPPPPPVPTIAITEEQRNSDANSVLASDEESIGVTASGNLRIPEPKSPSVRIPNPPFEGSEPQTNQ